jgi:hypothetical protein
VVSIYPDDLAWLKRKQLEMSATQGKILPMCDVLRALIEAVQHAAEGA